MPRPKLRSRFWAHLRRYHHLGVLGAPGMGKTTLLRHIAHKLASSSWFARPLNYLPIYLSPQAIQGAICTDGDTGGVAPTLSEIIGSGLERVLPPPEDRFEHKLKHGRGLLLLEASRAAPRTLCNSSSCRQRSGLSGRRANRSSPLRTCATVSARWVFASITSVSSSRRGRALSVLGLPLNREDHRPIRQRAGPHVERRHGHKSIMGRGSIEIEHAQAASLSRQALAAQPPPLGLVGRGGRPQS
jgi:hypothetical protein